MNLKKKFKMTKKEKVLTLVLVGILVASGAYQVAYGTNESDYKYGYKDGVYEYHDCRIQPKCNVGVEENTYSASCDSGGIYIGFTPTYRVVNETACNHGYHHGWVKACLNDGGGLMCTTWHDGGPVIASITGPGRCYNNTGGQTCESGNFIPTH